MRVAIGLVVVLLLGAGVLWVVTPSAADLQTRLTGDLAPEGAALLAPDEIPALLAKAIVATEDERFYQHHGIDVVGLGRAALYDISHLCACQGGSTITQQLVKDLYLNGSDRGLSKLADMALALKVELQFSKAMILADYLSEVPTGYGLHGVSQAACAYFGRPLAALDLGQIALLAGMPQAPSAYDPRFHPRAAAARRSEVLGAMVSEGYITATQATAAGREPVTSTAGSACTATG
jgi:penicillin-binding protein 1A